MNISRLSRQRTAVRRDMWYYPLVTAIRR